MIYSLALIVGAILMLVPLFWMILTALKSFQEVMADPIVLFPERPRWENFVVVLSEFRFSRYFLNSLLVALLQVAGTLVSCVLAAYAFVAYRVRWANAVFLLLLSALMLPSQVTVVPLFKLFAAMGWVDTYLPLVVPSWLGLNVFAIFLLRQFFKTIPRDYIEAARIDGAGELRIIWSVFLPLSRPALIVVAIFTFLGSWNDLFGPLVYLHDSEKFTLPLGLLEFMATVGHAGGTPMHLIMAASSFIVLPVVVLFMFTQRYFIEGLSQGGVKG